MMLAFQTLVAGLVCSPGCGGVHSVESHWARQMSPSVGTATNYLGREIHVQCPMSTPALSPLTPYG